MKTEDLIADIENARDASGLHSVVEKFAFSIGMDGAYIINFHPSAGMTFVDKRPDEWLNYYGKEGYIHFDPIAHRAFKGGESFTWDDCIANSQLTKGQKMLMHQARDFGLNQGYNTVANTRDYSAATCCFYNRDSKDFFSTMRFNRPLMDSVGHAAQNKLGRLVEESFEVPALTSREVQCLTEAARGATNEVIGNLFNISKNTVNSHIQSACKTLGVRTKIQAVSLAIQLKIIFPIKFTSLR